MTPQPARPPVDRVAPRPARWLLERSLDRVTAEALLGDLVEEAEERAATAGAPAARRWFWRQTWRSIAAHRAGRARTLWRDWRAHYRRAGLMNGGWQDLRLGIRTLLRAPLFGVTAVLTLAVGIGAATAFATAAHRTLVRALPYPHGDRLVHIGHPDATATGGIGNVGYATVVDWRARLRTLEELSIVRQWTPTLIDDRGAERLDGLRVSWNFFRTLGVTPAIGRDFRADEDHPDRWRVVMISDGLWRRRFGGRPDIAGSTIEFNGRRFEVAGVLPASFEALISQRFYQPAEVWAPLGYALSGDSSCRSCQHLKLIGRLAPGATIDDARAELATVHADLRRAYPNDYTETPPAMSSLADTIAEPVRRPIQVIFLAAALLLIVACANVAGLLVARATGREREMVVRAALGAGRGRLVRQLLTESAVLAIASAAIGLIIARVALVLLAAHAPIDIPGLDRATADPALWVLGSLMAGGALLLFGLLPAWTAARLDLQAILRDGRQSANRRTARAREVLMVAEVALAVLLLAGAAMMVRTVQRLLSVDPGFESRGVLTLGVSLVGQRWAEDSTVRAFQSDFLTRVRALPGVERAALAGQIPLGNNYDRWGFRIEGRRLESEADAPSVERYSVTPDYFATMKIPLREGRLIDARDTLDAPLVLLVGETTARTLWPDSSPIGRRVRIGGPNETWRTIVGVVGDVRHYSLSVPPTMQMYAPQAQMTDSFLILVARAGDHAGTLLPSIRRELTGIAGDVPIYDVALLDERLATSVAPRRFLMLLLSAFAVATIVLAAIGLYGVVSQAVAGRRRELGIRFALGASRRDVVALVMRRGIALVAIGGVAGVVAAAVVGRLLSSQLYETSPADPVALSAAMAALVAAALVAHAVPLHRATHVSPTIALRND